MRRSFKRLICGVVLAGLLALGGASLVVGDMAEAKAFCCSSPPPGCGQFGLPKCK